MSDKHLKRRHKKKNADPSCRKIIRWPRLLEIIPLGKTPIHASRMLPPGDMLMG